MRTLLIIGLVSWIGFLYFLLNDRDNYIVILTNLLRQERDETIRRGKEIKRLKKQLEGENDGTNNG